MVHVSDLISEDIESYLLHMSKRNCLDSSPVVQLTMGNPRLLVECSTNRICCSMTI